MSFDLSDYNDMLDRKREVAPPESVVPMLNRLTQAAIKAQYLTNDENWNFFLSLLQSVIEVTEAELREVERKIGDPTIVDTNDIMRLKIASAILRERATTLKDVIGLPQSIKDDGKMAKEWLAKFSKGNGADSE